MSQFLAFSRPLNGSNGQSRTIVVLIADDDITLTGHDEFLTGQIQVDPDGSHIIILPAPPVAASPITTGCSVPYIIQHLAHLYRQAQLQTKASH